MHGRDTYTNSIIHFIHESELLASKYLSENPEILRDRKKIICASKEGRRLILDGFILIQLFQDLGQISTLSKFFINSENGSRDDSKREIKNITEINLHIDEKFKKKGNGKTNEMSHYENRIRGEKPEKQTIPKKTYGETSKT